MHGKLKSGMLVLSRKVGQRVVIDGQDGQIIVDVVRKTDRRVWLGFVAPAGVAVDREEIYLDKQRSRAG